MKRKIEQWRRRLVGIPRIVAVALLVLVLAGALFSMMVSMKIVTVQDASGMRRTLMTGSDDPRLIAQMAGLGAGQHDEVIYQPGAAGGQDSVIIRRALPISIKADGETHTAELLQGTVQDALNAAGVQLGPDDYTQPAADTPLAKGMAVEVMRVHYTQETRAESLANDVVNAFHAESAAPPAEEAFTTSFNGAYDVTYRDKFVNGVLHSSQIVDIDPQLTPRPLDSFELEPGVPCSRIAGYDDIHFGADGLPLEYTRVWEGAVCTAYSASRGRGSSGLGLYCGTAAVNPNVIPYGTRMFITSADGSFVYGFCIATDTGTAMMEGHVDLDLFFETNAEARRFGKRQLNVYFLD